MSDLIKAFDRANPEHREINNETYYKSNGTVEITDGNGSVASDTVVDYRDAGKETDRAYSMILGGDS